MVLRRNVLLGGLAATALPSGRPHAQSAPGGSTDSVTVLQIRRRSIEVNGKPASILAVAQPDGTPGLVTAAGRRFRVHLQNELDVPSLIHWHGLTPPWQQDGVPRISGPPIGPGSSAEYDFPLRFGGTFWMHSHQGLQEQALLAAPLIIHDARDRADQREIVMMLADFSFTPAEEIMAGLRKGGSMAGMGMQPPAAGMMAKVGQMVMKAPMGHAAGPDLNDVTYDAFLSNHRTLSDPEVIAVEPGETVLLRVINSSSMSAYHLDLGALSGELVAVDGSSVRPVAGRRFPIAVAQRLDIRVTLPREPAAHPILAILEGTRRQTGLILRSGSRAEIRRVPDVAAVASPPLNLDLERALRATEPLAPRKADRVHQLDLTGQMMGYVWSINGIAWTKDVPPLPVASGEHVELVFRNQTPMPHPMHLHGHQFQVVEIDGKRFSGAVRDTVLVTPGTSVVVAFDANNPGLWALHCHLLYHLDAGMFTTLRYL